MQSRAKAPRRGLGDTPRSSSRRTANELEPRATQQSPWTKAAIGGPSTAQPSCGPHHCDDTDVVDLSTGTGGDGDSVAGCIPATQVAPRASVGATAEVSPSRSLLAQRLVPDTPDTPDTPSRQQPQSGLSAAASGPTANALVACPMCGERFDDGAAVGAVADPTKHVNACLDRLERTGTTGGGADVPERRPASTARRRLKLQRTVPWVPPPKPEDVVCAVCGDVLTGLIEFDRQLHVNRCIDKPGSGAASAGVAPAPQRSDARPEPPAAATPPPTAKPVYPLFLAAQASATTTSSGANTTIASSKPKRSATTPALARQGTMLKHVSRSATAVLMNAARTKVRAPASGNGRGKGSKRSSGSSSSGGFMAVRRNMPWYKKMPGTPFVVDAFNFLDSPKFNHFVLTHFHRCDQSGV